MKKEDHGSQHQQPQRMHGGGGLDMPPGFRFNPSDEEIITFYLTPKVQQRSFTCAAIGEVDLNGAEPWELPGMFTHTCTSYLAYGHKLVSCILSTQIAWCR
jgi:hypothetical protein